MEFVYRSVMPGIMASSRSRANTFLKTVRVQRDTKTRAGIIVPSQE